MEYMYAGKINGIIPISESSNKLKYYMQNVVSSLRLSSFCFSWIRIGKTINKTNIRFIRRIASHWGYIYSMYPVPVSFWLSMSQPFRWPEKPILPSVDKNQTQYNCAIKTWKVTLNPIWYFSSLIAYTSCVFVCVLVCVWVPSLKTT